jgi:hypothetical protein
MALSPNNLPRGRAHEVVKFQKKQITSRNFGAKKTERDRASGN